MAQPSTRFLCGAALVAVACTHGGAKREAAGAGGAAQSTRVTQPVATAQPERQAESEAPRAAAAQGTDVVVNGEPLSDETIQQLQQVYPVAIPPGRYWYDAIDRKSTRLNSSHR